ncbi:MAG: ABC transporter substrate-binding protein [Spirochaetia bacterium]|jgi:ABC-type glycerol-3-phosphate transport system substrate-binding protein
MKRIFSARHPLVFILFSVLLMITAATVGFSQARTIQIYIPWGVERTEGTDPMANAFRAWRDQAAAKKFPNLKVQVITANWDDHWTWLRTRIASKDAPDVVVQRVDQGHGYVTPTAEQESQGQSFWIPLDDVINAINPYTGKTLASEYSASALAAARGTLKKLYYLPISQGARAFIYNADAFRSAGITKAPGTAQELLDDLAKLRASGWKYPMGGTGMATDAGFAMDIANGLAASSLLSWFTSIAGSDPVNPNFKALYQAFADSKISYSDPRIRSIFEFQKKVADYVDPATYSRNFDAVYGPFTNGDFALMSEYNGRFIRVNAAIKSGSAKVTNTATFGYPVADKKTFSFSDALVTLPGQISSWGCTFSIYSAAKSRGTYDAAVDFLQWWASGAEDMYAWNRDQPDTANGDVPPTKSAINAWKFKSAGESMLQDFAAGWGALMLAPNGPIQEKIYPYAQAYEQGQITYEELAKQADQILKKEANLALAQM